jgi:DNA-binding transcriptional LysR family regulator
VAQELDLKQLERFAVAAEIGNIGAAASRLNLSQPALTRSIHLLEESVGAPLFDRMSRGVKLTVMGIRLLPYANLMLRERARLLEVIDEVKGPTGGLIRFGVTGNLEDWAAASIASLRRVRPDVRFSISAGAVSDLLAKLQDGSLDMALSMVGSHAIPENMVFEPLFKRAIAILARGEHPLAKKPDLSLQDLADAKWIQFGGETTRNGLRNFFERAGVTAPQYTIWCESHSALKLCLLSDDYITMIDTEYLAEYIASGAVRRLMSEENDASVSAGLIYRQDSPRPAAHIAFIQAVRRCAKQQNRNI